MIFDIIHSGLIISVYLAKCVDVVLYETGNVGDAGHLAQCHGVR